MKYIQKTRSLNNEIDLNLTLFVLPSRKRIMHLYNKSIANIELPNLCFILLSIYNKNTKKHIYGGIYRDALHICCSKNPIDLNNIEDNSFYYVNGYTSCICTNHDYDDKEFDSIEEMMNFLTDEFLSLTSYYKEFLSDLKFNLNDFIKSKGFFDSYEEFFNYYIRFKSKKLIENLWKNFNIINYTQYNLDIFNEI